MGMNMNKALFHSCIRQICSSCCIVFPCKSHTTQIQLFHTMPAPTFWIWLEKKTTATLTVSLSVPDRLTPDAVHNSIFFVESIHSLILPKVFHSFIFQPLTWSPPTTVWASWHLLFHRDIQEAIRRELTRSQPPSLFLAACYVPICFTSPVIMNEPNKFLYKASSSGTLFYLPTQGFCFSSSLPSFPPSTVR